MTVTGNIGDPTILIKKLREAKKIAMLLTVSEEGVEVQDEGGVASTIDLQENIPATQSTDTHECSRCE